MDIVDDEVTALTELIRGATYVSAVIKPGFGPTGRYALREQPGGMPAYSEDPSQLLNDFSLTDAAANLGAQLAISCAQQVRDDVGDGFSSTLIFSEALLQQCRKGSAVDFQMLDLIQGVKQELGGARAILSTMARTWHDAEDVMRLTDRLCRDRNLAEGVRDVLAVTDVWQAVQIQDSDTDDCYVTREEGFTLEAVPASDRFLDEGGALPNALVLVTDAALQTVADVLPALEIARHQGRPLLIVAKAVSGEALQTLLKNRTEGTVVCAAVTPTAAGEFLRGDLTDWAIATGAETFFEVMGGSVREVVAKQLGVASVSIEKQRVIATGLRLTTPAVKAHKSRIQAEYNHVTDPDETSRLAKRLSRLEGQVAYLHVSAPSAAELKLRQDRAKRALRTLFVAREGGVVPGGGVALLTCARALDADSGKTPEQRLGKAAVHQALGAVFHQLAANAGLESEPLVAQVGHWQGYDFEKLTPCALDEAGIVDPYRTLEAVLRVAESLCEQVMRTAALLVKDADRVISP